MARRGWGRGRGGGGVCGLSLILSRSRCAWQGRFAALYGFESSFVLSDFSQGYFFFLSSLQSIITVSRCLKVSCWMTLN